MITKLRLSDKKVIQSLILLCALIGIILSIFGDKGWLQLRELKERKQRLSREIHELHIQKQEWVERVLSLKSNQTYMENLARERLGLILKDEKIMLLQVAEDENQVDP